MGVFLAVAVLALLKQEPISGTIVGPDGKPVSGATVSLILFGDEGRHVGAQVKSGSDGRYEIIRPAAKENQVVGQIAVVAPGLAVDFLDIFNSPPPKEFRLRKGASAVITLRQPNGSPASGVVLKTRVLVRRKGPSGVSFFSFYPEIPGPSATTDAQGKCELKGLPPGDDMQLDLQDERFARLGFRETIHLAPNGEPVQATINLKAGSILFGKVVNGGKPVADVRVVAQSLNYEAGGEATTGPDGTYRMLGLEGGAYHVALYLPHPLDETRTAVAHDSLVVKAGERKKDIDFQLIPGAIITGLVKSPSGKPLARQPVGVYGPAHPRSGAAVGSTMTGADGRYRIRVPGGSQFVYVMGEGGPNKTITVKDGQTQTVDFTYAPPQEVTIVGKVVDESGKPVAGATVDIVTTNRDIHMDPGQIQTDASGNFRYLATGNAPLIARARLGADATVEGKEVSPSAPATLRLKRGATGRVSGKAVDEKGKPIAGAHADLIIWAGDYGNSAGSAIAGPDGTFSFDGLYPDSDVSFFVTAPGRGKADSGRVRPIPGELVKSPPLTLPVANSFVAGRVIDEKGRPVVGAQVTAMQYGDLAVTSDVEGKFRIEKLPAGEHPVGVSLGGRFLERQLKTGTTNNELVLKTQPVADSVPSGPEPKPLNLLGKAAPALQVGDWVNGKAVKLSNLRGKIVLIDFWAIWCGPCRKTLPEVRRLAKKYKGSNVVVMGIHDSSTWPKELTEFAKKNALTYPLAIDNTMGSPNQLGKTMRAYGVQGIPTFTVIDTKGKVAYQGFEHQAAEATIERLRKLGE